MNKAVPHSNCYCSLYVSGTTLPRNKTITLKTYKEDLVRWKWDALNSMRYYGTPVRLYFKPSFYFRNVEDPSFKIILRELSKKKCKKIFGPHYNNFPSTIYCNYMFFASNFILPCLPLQFTSKFFPCLRAASSHVSVNFHDNKKRLLDICGLRLFF